MPRRRRPLRLAAFALAGAAAWLCRPEDPSGRPFEVRGVVRVQPELLESAERAGAALFVIARGAGDIPIAVQRQLSPTFPASFTLTEDDLLFPGLRAFGPLRLQAVVNTHGRPGNREAGDLLGEYPIPVEPGEGPVPITIDRSVVTGEGAA